MLSANSYSFDIYTICFIVSLACVFILVTSFSTRVSKYYVLLFVAIFVRTFGCLELRNSTTIQEAVLGKQIEYLGVSFVPLFLLMCVADLCKTKINPFLRRAIACWGLLILGLVMTIDRHQLYYKRSKLINDNGVAHLINEYGPLHTLWPLYMFTVFLMCLVISIGSFRRKDVSQKHSLALIALSAIIIVGYSYERIFGLAVDLTPISLVIAQIVLLLLLIRIRLYDVDGYSISSMKSGSEFGFIVIDSKNRFLGCNEQTFEWFPELRRVHVDSVIKNIDTPLTRQIARWHTDEFSTEKVAFECGDRIIEGSYSAVRDSRHAKVNCIALHDETDQYKYTRLIEKYNEDLESAVEQKTKKLRDIQMDIVISMANIVDNRDHSTGGHVARTSHVVRTFVDHLVKTGNFEELTPRVSECIIKAAPLHDFGKIAIPDSVLNKPGRFTDEEYQIMKKHSEKGAEVVRQILKNSDDDLFRIIAVNVAFYHHEKWDGNGYPKGISGNDIPFEARVMALADVFDALVSKRVYKERMSYDEAFRIIEESSGTHFEPILCEEFLKCRHKLESLYNAYNYD